VTCSIFIRLTCSLDWMFETIQLLLLLLVVVVVVVILLLVYIDAKLHFHDHVNHIFSDCIKLLGLIRSITLHFSSLECMLRLYITLVRSKIEYASVVWNLITSTDANKLERIQQRFVTLCFKRFFNPEVPYCYSFVLEELKLLTLRVRRHHLDAFFLTQV
jgi:hypothetical protein